MPDRYLNEAEKEFKRTLADMLEASGFVVFLPQRDGAERDRPPYDKMEPEERRVAMFNLDREQIFEADIFLFILDGRVPDEGACVELGIAYAHKYFKNRGKILVGLHTDSRAAFIGSKLNPMIKVPLDYIASGEADLIGFLKERSKRFMKA